MFKSIVALVLALSVHDQQVETEDAYLERMDTISQAISEASEGNLEVQAFLLMTASEESDFAWRVHAGKCRPDECDGGKAGTIWQIQHGSWFPKKEWLKLIGLGIDPTTRAAKKAAEIYLRGKRTCHSVKGAISLYATGRTCSWHGAQTRSRKMGRILEKLKDEDD